VGHGVPEVTHGPDAQKQSIAALRAAFPDFQLTIEDLIAEGDKVVLHWTARGTHKGEFMGIAPTGKQATVTGLSISRFAGGRIVELREIWDRLGLLQQLGVVPPMGEGGE